MCGYLHAKLMRAGVNSFGTPCIRVAQSTFVEPVKAHWRSVSTGRRDRTFQTACCHWVLHSSKSRLCRARVVNIVLTSPSTRKTLPVTQLTPFWRFCHCTESIGYYIAFYYYSLPLLQWHCGRM